ncbi:MAG: hypothetical protein LBN74_03010 [Prevotella sp.]|jgi:hypothetical protein|nr:hypothetical protein [Prevotella sp.]
MKQFNFKLIAALAMFALVAISAQAQVTPQAVIGNAPSLPSPEQWAANNGHTEAFKAKIAELNGKLNEMSVIQLPTVTEADMQQAQAAQQRKMQEQQRRQQRDMKNAQKNMEQAQDAMAMLNLTPAEIAKLEKMSDKEIEAFMRKRMAEKGVDPMTFTTDYSEADARRDREAEAQGQALFKAQEAQEAYMNQLQVTSKKIAEAEKAVSDRISALWESRKDAIAKAAAECAQPEEVMRGTITKEQLESYCRRYNSLVDDYEAAAYHIWITEYVGVAQGHLKFLMPYAQAYDDAQKTKASVVSTGNAAIDQLQAMPSHAAVSIASQYLAITVSEPESNM